MALLGINAHLLSGQASYRRAGIHHYIENVLKHLPAGPPVDEYAIFTRYQPDWGRPDMRFVTTRWPTENRWVRILWEQLAWPAAAARRDLDLLHSMAFVTPFWQPCPTIVTVYDLSFLHFPHNFPPLQRLYLKTQSRRSCRAAARVTTISESGRQDVHHYFGVPLDRIDVAPPAVEPAYHPPAPADVAAFRERHDLPHRFLLHVGTLQPRKNLPLLIEALGRLRRPELPLVLVGGKGWLYDDIFARIEALGLEKQVRFVGYAPADELPLWYAAATVLVFPSVYEGFGMPVVEAMACGTPVVAADAPGVREAAGDAALLFSPHDGEALVNQILAVLDNPALAATMRERGLAHAHQFSWTCTGETIAGTYRQTLESQA